LISSSILSLYSNLSALVTCVQAHGQRQKQGDDEGCQEQTAKRLCRLVPDRNAMFTVLAPFQDEPTKARRRA
jgi:hypothetical protein